MKRKLTPFILLVFIYGFMISGCSGSGKSTEKHKILVLLDITGSTTNGRPTVQKVMNDIYRIYPVMEDEDLMNDGFQLDLNLLDDLSGSQMQKFILEPAPESWANRKPKKRKREVKKFFENFKNALDKKLSQSKEEKPFSKLYSKFCRTFKNFKEGNFDDYTVFIYSDLLENSELARFYEPKTLKQAAQDPVKFAEAHFENACKMTSLNGMKIYLYPYRNTATDPYINLAEKFWTEYLSSKGADVKVDY